MAKKKLSLWLAIICIAVVGLVVFFEYSKYYPSTDDAYVNANVVHIAPQVSGDVVHIFVKNNEIIKKGQRLFDIDPRPFEIALANAKAQLDLAKQDMRALFAAVQSAKAVLKARQSEFYVTLKNAARTLILVKKNLATKESGDEAENSIKVAKAQLDVAKNQLKQAKENLGMIGNKNARIKAALAEVRNAELNLKYAYITSPVNGKLVNFTLRSGTMVQAGQMLFDIVEQNRWWVDTNYKETQLDRIRVGQSAKISVDMYPNHTFRGVVESISAGSGTAFSLLPPEQATGTWVKVTQRMPVKIVILNPSLKFPLIVGASASVTVDTTH